MPPSRKHQTLLRLFRDDPSLLSTLGVMAPGRRPLGALRPLPADEAALAPTGLAVDAVFVRGDPPELAIAFEVQLRTDPTKLFSWPAYLANLRMRRRCPTILVVICPDPNVARWASRPIETGGGTIVRLKVISPDDVPRADRVRPEALSATLAVLSAMVHRDDDVLQAGALALRSVDDETDFQLYANMLCDTRPGADQIVRAMMETDPQLQERSRGIFAVARREAHEEGREEGREEGLRKAVRAVLSARRLAMPADLEARLAAADEAQLEAWLARAATAEAGVDVLG